MTTEEALRRWGFVPALSSLSDVRRELVAETKRRQNDIHTEDLLFLLCVQLFAARQPEDSLQIWRARQGDFDASIYIGGQLLCGAGVETTKQYLRHSEAPEAPALLEYIGEQDWSNFTPDEHLAYYHRYFSAERRSSKGLV